MSYPETETWYETETELEPELSSLWSWLFGPANQTPSTPPQAPPSTSPGIVATSPGVTVQLPGSGTGFYAYSKAERRFGRAETIRALQSIAAAWNRAHPSGPRIGIGDVSKYGGGPFPPHKSHQTGLDVDIRPMRNDGREEAVRHDLPTYSRPLTQELVDLIRRNGILSVKYVFFNDSMVTGTKPWPGHDNHLHVRFVVDATTVTSGARQPAASAAVVPAPSAAPAAGGLRSTQTLRTAWRAYECQDRKMTSARLFGRSMPVPPETVAAWQAFERALTGAGYNVSSAWTYNCRVIAGTSVKSLHSYGIAMDVDPSVNPYTKTPDKRSVRFSSGATQELRASDVRRGVADTTFTPAQVAAVESIRTRGGLQVFAWGGRWSTIKDTMHFQVNVTPAELAAGLM